MKARVILIMKGGMIQQSISNIELEIVNLDWDIMECDLLGEEYYEYRIEKADQVEDFIKTEKELINEWNEEMDKTFNYKDKQE